IWLNALHFDRPRHQGLRGIAVNSPALFYTYAVFLVLSGVAMLVLAGIRSWQSRTRRVWNAILGAGFTLYGLYLLVLFHGSHYILFFYAFILPILMIVQFFRDRSAGQARQQAGGFQGPLPGYGQPGGFGQPPQGYGQPAPGYGQQDGFGQPASGYDPASWFGQPSEQGQPSGGYGQPSGHDEPPAGQTQNPAP
ncbi:MAG TPA: hypothetical protein VEV45_22205, partial [Streptosporangiaceae bacterium]|nr:hypothetical protein [Streptosporangiaceae bacterium]